MKSTAKFWLCVLLVPALLMLGGCSGYAAPAAGPSGVQVYGAIDTGVQRESR